LNYFWGAMDSFGILRGAIELSLVLHGAALGSLGDALGHPWGTLGPYLVPFGSLCGALWPLSGKSLKLIL
jgi:hypothetical protein